MGHLFRHSLTQPINVSHDNREISLKYDRARLDSECASGMTKSGALNVPSYFCWLAHQLRTRSLTLPEPCLLYTSPSPRDVEESRMPSSA